MIPVASRQQVRELDRRAIEELGLPGVALMESASRALAQAVLDGFEAQARADGVLLVCGGGNNGGDGFGAARWLHAAGIDVRIWALAEQARGDAAIHRQAAERLGLRFMEVVDASCLRRFGVLVDCLFGTGLSRDIEGHPAKVIRWMNDSGRPVVAADLPSGLDADSGMVHGVAVRAATTVTFGAAKPGLYAGSGPDLAGDVVVDPIGLSALRDAERLGGVVQAEDLREAWPRRASDAHKTRSGHVGIVAGSTAMAGAAVLCCRGALAAGAGLVTLVVPAGALPRLASLPAEVMVHVSGQGDRLEPPSAHAALSRPSAWVLGPGLGGGEPLSADLGAWLAALWTGDERPALADADALVAVAGQEASTDRPAGTPARVITPHPGEAARLLGCSVDQVQADRFSSVQALTRAGDTALLKGPHTLVATRGCPVHVNPTGHPVLATGGTGDVLSGVIGALLAAGVTGHRAATLGAFVHGLAAEQLAATREVGWTASDVADAIPAAVASLIGGSR